MGGFLLPPPKPQTTSLTGRGSQVEEQAATREDPLEQAPRDPSSSMRGDLRLVGDRFWGHSIAADEEVRTYGRRIETRDEEEPWRAH